MKHTNAHQPYQPKTGAHCHCRRGVERDNCPTCEGTGMVVDFAAIRARRLSVNHTIPLADAVTPYITERPVVTPAQATAAASALRGFINENQLACIVELTRGEEGQFFMRTLVDMAARIAVMPEIYGQDGKGDEATIHLHYFTAGADWYITEKDHGTYAADPEEFQWQAFGLADLFNDGGELGYISLPEILKAGAELDLHWNLCTLAQLRAHKAGQKIQPLTLQ